MDKTNDEDRIYFREAILKKFTAVSTNHVPEMSEWARHAVPLVYRSFNRCSPFAPISPVFAFNAADSKKMRV